MKDEYDVFQLADEILFWLTTMTQEKRIENPRVPLVELLLMAWGTTDEKVAVDKTIEYLKHKFDVVTPTNQPIYIKKNTGDIVIS